MRVDAAPVVAFYMPFYALSGGKMPPLSMACTFFAVLAALFLCEMLLAAVHLTVPRPNLLLLMGCMAGAVCVSGIGYEANTALRYNLPVLSGMCFLFLGLWLGFTALTRPQGIGRHWPSVRAPVRIWPWHRWCSRRSLSGSS